MRSTTAAVLALAVLVPAIGSGRTASATAPSARTSAAADEPTEVEEVVVTAQRAGVPIWTLRRNAGVVVLVGAIDRIPSATPWRPAQLQAAIAKADAVVLEPQASASVVDIGSIVNRARTIGILPEGQTVASRYGEDLDRRLAALVAAGKITGDYSRIRPLILSVRLLKAAEGPHARARAPDVFDIAGRAAKRAKVPRRPVLKTTVKTLLDEMGTDSPDDAVCLRAAIEAAEQGPEAALKRGRDWAERRIPQVLASAIERADEACGFERRGQVGDALRASWRNTVEVELTKPGVVVAVAPLRTVAGPYGILDTLKAQGVDIVGPRWRDSAPR